MPWRRMGKRRYRSTVLDFNTRLRWVPSLTQVPFALWKWGPGAHWLGCSVGPKAGLNTVEKRSIFHCRESNLGRSARIVSRCQLSYPHNETSLNYTKCNLGVLVSHCTLFPIIFISVITDAAEIHHTSITYCMFRPFDHHHYDHHVFVRGQHCRQQRMSIIDDVPEGLYM
jgi:hypothetical protein